MEKSKKVVELNKRPKRARYQGIVESVRRLLLCVSSKIQRHKPRMPHLPREICTEIIANLPVKTVLRCRSVCKEWRDVIDEPQFIAMQFSRAIKADAQSSFIFVPRWKEWYDVLDQSYLNGDDRLLSSNFLVDWNLQDPLLFEITNMNLDRILQIKGRIKSSSCVNGLLCISSHLANHLHTYIYNPATRDSVRLPDITCPTIYYWCTSTLCFDRSTGQYKVVNYFDWGRQSTEANVFTLGSNSWRKLEDVPDVNVWNCSNASVNSSIYWLTSDYIMRFDLASEKFGSIPYPESISRSRTTGVCKRILNTDGCLSIVDSTTFPRDPIEVWILMDGNVTESWKKFKIKTMTDWLRREKVFDNIAPISFNKKNGEILLLCDTNIVSYNIYTERYTLRKIQYNKVECQRQSGSGIYYDVYPYIGNLASVKAQEPCDY